MLCDASIFFIQTIIIYTQCMTLCTLRITLQTTGEAADTHCKVLCVQCIAYHAQYTHLMYKLLMLLLRLGSTCAFIFFFCVCVLWYYLVLLAFVVAGQFSSDGHLEQEITKITVIHSYINTSLFKK